jgi:ketosteroid isomerase-like protein
MRVLAMFVAIALAAPLGAASDQDAAGAAPGVGTLLEIRSYNLKPGEREHFHERFVRDSLPLLRKWKVDVVAFGPSTHDRDTYFLMRAFSSLEARNRDEDAFYASPEWRDGPREAVLAAIENYTTLIITVDRATLEGLRRTMATTATASDLDTITTLNTAYIDSVKHADATRFEELLAADFLCTQSDGSFLDRAQFLDSIRKAAPMPRLDADDVNVRLLGDVAIVHARTTFTLASGAQGTGRYTDVWARRDGRWQAVAAHVTRR